MKSILLRLADYYRILAIVFLNAVIFLIAINYIAAFFLQIHKGSGTDDDRSLGLFKYKKYDPALEPVYRGWGPEDVNQLLKETRSVSLGYEPYVQFRERPFHGRFVNVSPYGFRPVANQSEWPPNPKELNIFVFGGSTVFGYGVTDAETIASRLEEKVAQIHGGKVNVFNLGRCSYIFPQEVVFLERLLASSTIPHIAIFIDGLNDFAHHEGVPGFTKDLTRFMDRGEVAPFKAWFADWPIIKLLNAGGPDQKNDSKLSESAVGASVFEHYISNKKVVEALSKNFGIRVLFVWQPVPVYKYDQNYNVFKDFNYSRFLPYLKPGYEMMYREYRAGSLGENFLWLADMQENLKEPLYVDAVHYSARMSEMIAGRIVEKMISSGFLN